MRQDEATAPRCTTIEIHTTLSRLLESMKAPTVGEKIMAERARTRAYTDIGRRVPGYIVARRARHRTRSRECSMLTGNEMCRKMLGPIWYDISCPAGGNIGLDKDMSLSCSLGAWAEPS